MEPAFDLVVQSGTQATLVPEAFSGLLGHVRARVFSGGLRFHGVAPDCPQRAQIESMAQGLACDTAWVPASLTRRSMRVLVMDMDSTVITMECIDELAAMAGKRAEVAAITEAAMRGDITDFSESLRRRVALLAGTPAAIIGRVLEQRLAFSPGALNLLAGARSLGWHTLLVSGGFHAFADVVGARLGFDQVCANDLLIEGETLSGAVKGDHLNQGAIVDGNSKARQLQRFCDQLGVGTQQAIAVGDGANDLPMMELAGWSVAWRAKPRVRAAARCALDHCPLDAILNLFPDA